MASRIFRAADGVGKGYELRSALFSGRVKQAKSPDTNRRTLGGIDFFSSNAHTGYDLGGLNPIGGGG